MPLPPTVPGLAVLAHVITVYDPPEAGVDVMPYAYRVGTFSETVPPTVIWSYVTPGVVVAPR